MPQITSITSEALQATIRRLLPSQQGFGDDLQATNLITPIIDLTPTAEGSEVRQDLQTAITLNSQTTFEVTGAGVITETPGTGFFRFLGTIGSSTPTGSIVSANIKVSDGTTTKTIFSQQVPATTTNDPVVTPFDIVIFLNPGEFVQFDASSASSYILGSYRQIATVTGTLVNPAGFTIE